MHAAPDLGAHDGPAARLESAFRAAAERMRGLPIVNPALDVEAVGFAPWQGHWLGVMVTPWSINLTLVPGDAATWQSLAPGAKRHYRFPAGDYEFIGAHDPAIGEFQVCSLFSPVREFEDHATARLVAQLAREALFDAIHAEATDARRRDAARVEADVGAPLSRHDLLHGRFPGSRRDDRG